MNARIVPSAVTRVDTIKRTTIFPLGINSMILKRPMGECKSSVIFEGDGTRSTPSFSSPGWKNRRAQGRRCGRGRIYASRTLPQGTYIRDAERSDMVSYAAMLGLLQLGALQRLTAVQLIEGLRVEVDDRSGRVTLAFLTVVPFFDVTERYTMKGESENARRDLRPGRQYGRAQVVQENVEDGEDPVDVLVIESRWKAPNEGKLVEKLMLNRDGDLLVESVLAVAAGEERTRQVYTPVKKWVPKYSWNPITALQVMSKHK